MISVENLPAKIQMNTLESKTTKEYKANAENKETFDIAYEDFIHYIESSRIKCDISRKETNPLEGLALELAQTTEFYYDEIIKTMEYLVQIGLEVQELISIAPELLSFALISNLELEAARDIFLRIFLK